MTERLEKQLLSALEQLQQDYSKRLDEWERFGNGGKMSRTCNGRTALSERVTRLVSRWNA